MVSSPCLGSVDKRTGVVASSVWSFGSVAYLGDLVILTLLLSPPVNLLVESNSTSGPLASSDSIGGLLASLSLAIC